MHTCGGWGGQDWADAGWWFERALRDIPPTPRLRPRVLWVRQAGGREWDASASAGGRRGSRCRRPCGSPGRSSISNWTFWTVSVTELEAGSPEPSALGAAACAHDGAPADPPSRGGSGGEAPAAAGASPNPSSSSSDTGALQPPRPRSAVRAAASAVIMATATAFSFSSASCAACSGCASLAEPGAVGCKWRTDDRMECTSVSSRSSTSTSLRCCKCCSRDSFLRARMHIAPGGFRSTRGSCCVELSGTTHQASRAAYAIDAGPTRWPWRG